MSEIPVFHAADLNRIVDPASGPLLVLHSDHLSAMNELRENVAMALQERDKLQAEVEQMRTYSHETVKGLVDWRDKEIVALKAENARLSAPVSGEEWIFHGGINFSEAHKKSLSRIIESRKDAK